MRLILLLSIATLALAPLARSQDEADPPPEPTPAPQTALPELSVTQNLPDAEQGGEVFIVGKGFSEGTDIKIHWRSAENENIQDPLAGSFVDASKIKFTVQQPPGRYLLEVRIGDQTLPVPGELRVRDTLPRISSAFFRGHVRDQGFGIGIIGANLGTEKEQIALEVEGRGVVVNKLCTGMLDTGPCIQPEREGGKLEIRGFDPQNGEASPRLRVHVRGRESEWATLPLRGAGTTAVRYLAAMIFAALVGSIMWMVWAGLKKNDGLSYSPWAMLFLDKKTNTFSLSKFQILWWISITGLAYIYLFLTQTLVQRRYDVFPAIPENLPDLLAVSGATIVGIGAIGAARGSKGAGTMTPSAADFISVGGLVAGDRFQYFFWTILAGLSYLSLLWMSDPTTIGELPEIPDTLLYLTGVSAASYVGGRIVRKPGPVISGLSVTEVTGSAETQEMTIELQGESLSKDASLSIDDKPMRIDLFELRPPEGATEELLKRLTVVLKTSEAIAPLLEGSHTLKLTNPNGQSVSAEFPLDRMEITSVDTTQSPWEIKGVNFAEGTTAEPAGVVTYVAPHTLRYAPETPPESPRVLLTLTSKTGLRCSKDVEV